MPSQVSPPNPVMEFVVPGRDEKLRLSPVAFRFLTNITQALLGTPKLVISGQQIAQFSFGSVTLSTGALATPLGLLPGSIGDIFISTLGTAGGILFGKIAGTPGSTAGWTLIT